MGFWTVLDKIVGYIPVVGTVKDTVEAIVLEAEGKHEAAKEKAMEAAVDLVGDVVTVATFGTGYEVAAAGKMAAEVAIKEATESGAKSVAKAAMQEAVRDGYTKTAAIGIGAAAAGAHTKEKLKDSIAARRAHVGSQHQGVRRKPTRKVRTGIPNEATMSSIMVCARSCQTSSTISCIIMLTSFTPVVSMIWWVRAELLNE